MSDDAPLMLSFYDRPSGSNARLTTVSKVANAVRRARRLEPVELGDALSPNLVHYFTRDEVAAELGAAGVQMTACESDPYPYAIGSARRTQV